MVLSLYAAHLIQHPLAESLKVKHPMHLASGRIPAFLLLLGAITSPAFSHLKAQTTPAPALRAPATPLVTHDPYFSIWSMSDRLTDTPTKHWTNTNQPINGLLRVDGKTYRYLGNADRAIPALDEVSREITPTRTIVTMRCPEVELVLTFLTPAFPDDLRMLSRPVTYLSWTVKSRDAAKHEVAIYLDSDGAVAVNDNTQMVSSSRAQVAGLNLLRIGSATQPMLEKSGDNLRIDWGYFYFAIPQAEGAAEFAAGNAGYRKQFLSSGHISTDDDLGAPRAVQSRYAPSYTLNLVLPIGMVGSSPVNRHVLLAYDDRYSVEYLQQRLLPYWRKQFDSFASMLKAAEQDYPALQARARTYDETLVHDLTSSGGAEYAAIATLAFRQAIAAHKLVEDPAGVPFFMPKENFSNGSISTVDVIYPSAPMFLLLNPKLVEAQLEPVLRYAETSRWKFPFAPHDLGIYPLANGQLYGGGEATEENQMPVEESGDILLLVGAMQHATHSTEFAARHWKLLTLWAEYLRDKGFDPENQLSTDDFAGHLAHNTNLSIKAIEALAVYAQLAEQLGHHDIASTYSGEAKSMAAKWTKLAADGDHFRLAFDVPNSWSQKYNLVWDKILGLNLFPQSVADKEVSFYKSHLNAYGIPLDNRATYTKLDWELWSATLATSPEDFQALVHPIFRFLNETPDRNPMTDWYDTIKARQTGFQARSVVGGVYIKSLANPALWEKWAKRAEQNEEVTPVSKH